MVTLDYSANGLFIIPKQFKHFKFKATCIFVIDFRGLRCPLSFGVLGGGRVDQEPAGWVREARREVRAARVQPHARRARAAYVAAYPDYRSGRKEPSAQT